MGENDKNAVPPAAATGGGAESTPMIPKPRFDEVNTELKSSRQRIAELEAALAQARPAEDVPKESKTAAKPKIEQQQQASTGLDEEIRVMKLQLQHKVTEEAARLIYSYEKKGLEAADALDFAKSRQPKLFGEDPRGFDPSTHSSNRPGSGPAPREEKPPEPSRLEQLKALDDRPHEREKLAMKFAREEIKAQMFKTGRK